MNGYLAAAWFVLGLKLLAIALLSDQYDRDPVAQAIRSSVDWILITGLFIAAAIRGRENEK